MGTHPIFESDFDCLTEKEVKPEPHKMAHIARLERGDGYGFHLASETGNQFIHKIDEKSPAERAGIRDGDRLIGVNASCVIGLSHKEVVSLVRQSENEVALILVQPATNRDLTDNEQMRLSWPREVTLYRKENGFGFVLHSERIRKATKYYMTKITAGGAADEVGIANDDRLVKIDDTFISESIEHKAVVELIKTRNVMRMLLIHRESKMTLEEMDKMKLTSKIEAIQDDEAEVMVMEEEETAMVPPSTITDNNNNDSEKENLMQTQAEINSDATTETDKELDITQSQSRKTIVVSDQESSSIGTTQSTQSSNVEFCEMDFTRMSLSDLKTSIRHRPAPKRGPSVSEINWDQQKSVFKEL